MIHVIATSANIATDYHTRKLSYINGAESVVKHYGVKPYIIECVTATDYLNEDFVGNSNYSENQGINEFINIDEFFKANDSKFADDDAIVKMTLRYEIISSYLTDFISLNNYEVYCKSSADLYGAGDQGVHVFLFAMTYQCWKEFLRQVFNRNTHKDYPIEWQIAEWAKSKNTAYLNQLGILASPKSLRQSYKV